jgi:glutaredoxin 3
LVGIELYHFKKYSKHDKLEVMDQTKPIIYGAPWCAFCHTAMAYLDKLGVKYEYKDVEANPAAGLEAVNKSGQRGIPVIDVAGDIIIGFDRPKIDESLKSHGILAS